MRPPTRPGSLLALAVAVVALPAAAFGALPSGTASPTVIAANSTTYTDSTGEDPEAADITTIVVSNDDTGTVSIRINVSNRPTLAQDMWLDLSIDTDNNPSTGDPIGVDYVMQMIRGEINLYRWDGTGFTRRFGDPSAVTLSVSYQNGFTIRISAAELGNTKRFNFLVELLTGATFDPVTAAPDCSACRIDAAPGGGAGFFNYILNIAKPTLLVRRLTTTPAAPVAGKLFTMRLITARSDTGAVIQNGRVNCVGRVGTARLRAQTARVTGGASVCTWLIPKRAKGKTFRGSVAVSFEGLSTSRSFSRRIG